MKTSKTGQTILIIVFAAILMIGLFIAGLFFGFLAGTVGPDALNSLGENVYQSSSTIYVNDHTLINSGNLSSSSLSSSEAFAVTLRVLLESENVRTAISEEYPNIAYTLSIEQIDNTEIFTITAKSENREYVDDICNLATCVLCAEFESVIEGTSCKVVDHAIEPTAPISKNFFD